MTPANGRERQTTGVFAYHAFLMAASICVMAKLTSAAVWFGGCALLTLVDYAIAAYAFHLKGDR